MLAQDGVKAAPFKSQNMALNSYITEDGLEMGRAQVMQAEAAGIEPIAAMNPILLKPTNDTGSQVIINGKVEGTMSAMEYYRRKTEYIPVIMEAYEKLSKQYDIIVVEGAGSPAEINLKTNDIVNMGSGENDRCTGASWPEISTEAVCLHRLLEPLCCWRRKNGKRIKGTIINKFRGDKEILRPGLDMLVERTHVPVCGVVPYFYLDIDDEDSLSERFAGKQGNGPIDIAVIRFPRISNFTDLAALECREEVSLRYISQSADFGEPDLVILPGTKSTIADLLWMRQNGLEGKILRHASAGGLVFGICGGYQMLGAEVHDPDGVEAGAGKCVRGMELLPARTVFEPEKHRTQITGHFGIVQGAFAELTDVPFAGYEIHMGKTECMGETEPLLHLDSGTADGMQHGNVYGCYIHGIFDQAEVVTAVLKTILKRKGLDADQVKNIDRKQYKEEQYDKLADIIRVNLDMKMVYGIIERGGK